MQRRHIPIFRSCIGPLTWPTTLVLALLVAALPQPGSTQPLSFMNDRAHPELHWMERETEHFVVIYHQGLEDVAIRAVTVAEQVYEPILRGLELDKMSGKTSIVLTAEDQVVNGFAFPGKMFIWVNLNDYIVFFGGTDKWLRQVIAHEFQHDVWFEAALDWLGILGLIRTPTWFIEGLAEYQTEEWGAYRSDLAVRGSFLVDRHEALDPHDSGFTLVRYMAQQYGDSTIVHAVKNRNWLGLSNFAGSFKEKSGVSLESFKEEWRRVATAHTYALYSQKEEVADVGRHMPAPGRGLRALTFSADGRIAAALQRSSRRALTSLVVARLDSSGAWRGTREIDHGVINGDMGFAPDAQALVYAKKHRSKHGSWLWDLKVADVEGGTSRWITSGRRANHPHWSPVNDQIVFTAIDGSTTNLYTCNRNGEHLRQLTDHPGDVQVLSPRFSPDGKRIAFARFEAGRGIDLAVLHLDSMSTRYVTQGLSRDSKPLWSPDGSHVFFTSDRNRDEVPNLFVVPADGHEAQIGRLSDVGEALFGLDVDPRDGHVVALAMASTDTVRLRSVPPDRRVRAVNPSIRERFVSWRDRVPPNPIPPIDYTRPPEMSAPRPYRAYRRMGTLTKLVLPSPNPWGATALVNLIDAAHTHRVLLGADVGTDDGSFKLRGVYGNWETNRLPFGISGFLMLSGNLNGRGGFRIYGNELLRDQQSRAFVQWRFPMNFGEHSYANHQVELFGEFREIDVQNRDEIDVADLLSRNLPAPALDYVENKIGLVYRYTKVRPHARAFSHARRGHGLFAQFEWSDEALGSDLDFRRLNLDTSKAFGLPLIGNLLFGRVRFQSVWGEPAPQDFTGLRADPPILPSSYMGTDVLGDFLGVDEPFTLRGFAQNVAGEHAIQTTLECRLPLIPPLPVSVLGFRPGGLTGVVFYDHGRVWANGTERLARHTIGWEVRVPLLLGRTTLLVPSYGEGQTLHWELENAPFERDEYFRIAMVQPF